MNRYLTSLLTALWVMAGALLNPASANPYPYQSGPGTAYPPGYAPQYAPPPGYMPYAPGYPAQPMQPAPRTQNTPSYPSPAQQPVQQAAQPANPWPARQPGWTSDDSQPRLMILSAGHADPAKQRLLEELAQAQGLKLESRLLRKLEPDTQLADLVRDVDLLLLDDVNAKQTQENFASLMPQVEQLQGAIKVVALRWPQDSALRKDVTEQQGQTLERYFANGGRKNFDQMLRFIRAELLGQPVADAIKPPIIFPDPGIYHPQQAHIFGTPQTYLEWYRQNFETAPNAPVVGIMIHQGNLASENTAIVDDMIRRIVDQGAIPLAFYYRSGREADQYADWLKLDGKAALDVLINTRVIHWAEAQQKLFDSLGVSVVHAINHMRDAQNWHEDNGGIPAMAIPFYLTLSEIAGATDPKVVAARNKEDGRYHAIEEQMDLLIRKSVRLARLARIPNQDKKVAILYYNYPPGEKNAGASFLNVPRSIQQISSAMREQGYHTETIEEQAMIDAVANLQRPYYRKESPAAIVEKGVGGTLPVAEYRQWFATLPEKVRTAVEEGWGQPEDHFMVAEIDGEPHFVIPMLRSGNLMVLPQPPRGDKGEREKSIYHSKNLPINHYYLAVYLYLRNTFGADALVHLGTHGSHEWLPGKERGLWAYDPGSLTADDVPVIYPYIVDDVGEALQAKRRGHAVMISHMTPPFAPSGLYREMSEIHELMHQHDTLDPGLVKKRTRQQLVDKLTEMKIPQDMGWAMANIEPRFDDFMLDLHDYLHDLAGQNQPLGLHTWGKLAEDRLLTTTIMQILGTEYATRAAQYVYQQDDHSHDDHDHSHQHGDHTHQHADAEPGHQHDQIGGSHTHTGQAMQDQGKLEELPGFALAYDTWMRTQPIPADVPDALKKQLERGRELLGRTRGILEMDSFFAALNGRFILPSTGGDPIRNDESLPTGRNLYGFDPSRLPPKAAYESGKQLIEKLIQDYVAKHGRYPQKMAFSLWSIEAMRHHGVLESQALYAMGLRPVWAESGRVTGTEIIPYSELKRPRIDVVLSATGLYRDAFPGVMQMLAEGVKKIAELKENNNFVYRHTERLREQLRAKGMSEEDADYLSTVRIFSRETGGYGTGLNAAALASDTWENDAKLARLYMDRMGYAFGADPKRWNEKPAQVDLYAKNLSGTDVALFSRSSNLYGLLTSDDPFQYLGGLSLAVRNLDGRSPEMFITNLRDPDREKMETLNTFLSKELRTRYFHPRWIEEMQKEGYAGTLNIVDTVNNFWGWQVVDPQNIRADQWQEFFEVYVNDKYDMQMKEWFEQHNAEALAQISERMLEAIRKGYWQPDQDTIKKLVETWQELAAKYDVQTINQKFKDYVAEQATGFGLAAPNITPIELPPVAVPQPVQGQKLEKVEQSAESETDYTQYVLLLLILLTVLAGMGWQGWRPGVRAK